MEIKLRDETEVLGLGFPFFKVVLDGDDVGEIFRDEGTGDAFAVVVDVDQEEYPATLKEALAVATAAVHSFRDFCCECGQEVTDEDRAESDQHRQRKASQLEVWCSGCRTERDGGDTHRCDEEV